LIRWHPYLTFNAFARYAGSMARDESDREDLLREATALVERIELSARDGLIPRPVPVRDRERGNIVIGFRAGGAVSIFFGADPVYQFNTAGELRRAYCDGLLFKADRHRLVSLRRVREHDAVQLVRQELTDPEQSAFLSRMSGDLRDLRTRLHRDAYDIVGQIPVDADVSARALAWLDSRDTWPVAMRPHAF
jgi:hypothetical protein